jgi:UDP-N-acetylmuramoyl-tripeptide--D-alanyl-D-alanine ligase
VASPTIGVVTVVAAVHTETFGDVEGVARAKSELVAALPPSGTAVLNADDERVAAMATRTSAAVVRFGRAPAADVTATDVVVDDGLQPSFTLRSPWGTAPVRLVVRGGHQVGNALARRPPRSWPARRSTPSSRGWRRHRRRRGGWRSVARAPARSCLNDAYNANPTSMAAALHALAALPARRRFAYLGTMAELGDGAAADHAAVAADAGDLGITVVSVAEPRYGSEAVADVAGSRRPRPCARPGDGDAVLVKGSRVAGLERLADLLLDGAVSAPA